MTATKSIPALQFALFRIAFGIYLTIHFVMLAPYAAELYSSAGVLPIAAANPTFKLFPSIFWISDSPLIATCFVWFLAAVAVCFTLGYRRRTAALLLWWGWACLFNRNVLTSNPSLSYVGLLLVLSALIPPAEPLRIENDDGKNWSFPSGVYWSAWILMAFGYTFSGVVKLESPSWVDGTALQHLMLNPLARPTFVRDFFLALPPIFLAMMTWGALAAEIAFVPLSFLRFTRAVAWFSMIGLHLGILMVVDFADLTLGMLFLHAFTFDPDWFPARRDGKRRIVFFDGECGLCKRSIQHILDLDTSGILRVAPLQGETAAKILPAELRTKESLQTLVYAVESPEGYTLALRMDAVIELCRDVGGIGRFAVLGYAMPPFLRNWLYSLVANNRLTISKTMACRMPTNKEREQLMS